MRMEDLANYESITEDTVKLVRDTIEILKNLIKEDDKERKDLIEQNLRKDLIEQNLKNASNGVEILIRLINIATEEMKIDELEKMRMKELWSI